MSIVHNCIISIERADFKHNVPIISLSVYEFYFVVWLPSYVCFIVVGKVVAVCIFHLQSVHKVWSSKNSAATIVKIWFIFFLLKFIIFCINFAHSSFFRWYFFCVSTIGINERKMRTTFHGFASIIHIILIMSELCKSCCERETERREQIQKAELFIFQNYW